MFRNVLDHRYFIWTVLALPSIPMIAALVSGASGPDGQPMTEMLLHPTGEFSARFLIITMMLSPLRMLFPGSGFLRWMIKRRRYFGMAAFFYALFHTALYVIDMGSLQTMLGEFLALGIWTGWLAMLIFIPLALTSTDSAVRKLGPRWCTFFRSLASKPIESFTTVIGQPQPPKRCDMQFKVQFAALSVFALLPFSAAATGIHQCEATERSEWLSKAEITDHLEGTGWSVRFVKEDGGCWEVYGTDPEGQRVEGYFHPVTGAPELIAQRGRILFRADKSS